MDGDGDLDLATADAAAQNTTILANARLYRNDGADQFVEALSNLRRSRRKPPDPAAYGCKR
jgi:hypothetical protein